MAIDWDEIRKTRFAKEGAPEWPDGVRAISLGGLGLLGVHEETNKLYWDGKEVVTRNVIRLGSLELCLAILAAGSTVGMFVLGLGSAFGLWN